MNANETINRVNLFLRCAKLTRNCVSGYRPPEINANVPGSKPGSKHQICKACDVEDMDRKLRDYCLANLAVLEACQLWIEDPESTKTWIHFQTVPPGSGRRVFIP